MRTAGTAAIIVCAGALAACGHAISRQEFDARREAMGRDPVAYRKEIAECHEKTPQNPKYLEALGQLANTSPENATRVVCERFNNAVRDGKITYEQYNNQFKGTVDPALIRIAQGR